jgi:hypothetical protein
MIKPYYYTFLLTFTNEVLGTKPGDPEILRKYIASKRPEGVDEAEVEAIQLSVDEQLDRGTTMFSRDRQGRPCIMDYQFKGFFKEAQSVINKVPGMKKLPAHKKIVNTMVFVADRFVPVDCTLGICERPLRAQTPQGERVSIARSESIPEGSTMRLRIKLLDPSLLDDVIEWLDYGSYFGIGQWRSSGKGTFTYELVEEDPDGKAAREKNAKAAKDKPAKKGKAAAVAAEEED